MNARDLLFFHSALVLRGLYRAQCLGCIYRRKEQGVGEVGCISYSLRSSGQDGSFLVMATDLPLQMIYQDLLLRRG